MTTNKHQAPTDLVDNRGGANDPGNDFGKPQPHQPREKRTAHEDAQGGADVRSEPLPREGTDTLPEGLRRPRMAAGHRLADSD